ncbi:MAG: hypothetical protein QXQ79_02250 [Candidatus Nanoarchaeia archaeon]
MATISKLGAKINLSFNYFKKWLFSENIYKKITMPNRKLPFRLAVKAHEDWVDFVHGTIIGLLLGFLIGFIITDFI